MPNAWFRLYSEFEDDPKVQMMPEAMQCRLVKVFCSRCKEARLTDAQRAFKWRITANELLETKILFLEQGFIDEQWNPIAWNRRQFLSDSSTERVRRYRKAVKQDETLHETVGNVTVTAPDTEQIQNRTDTEQNKKTKPLRRNKSVADERASPFKEDFDRAFKYANNAPAPWSAKEATNLRNWLVANPTITREQWQKILNNRQRSPINKALSLSVWIGKALSWLNAPADEWGKPISGGHQNGKGTFEKPTTADRQAVELQRSVRDYATTPRADQDGGSALGDGGGPGDPISDPRSVGADSW